MQLVSKFRIFLDYKRERIILEPNDNFAKPFDRAHAGLAIQAEGKDYRTFRIDEVLEKSPASAAGLQINDVIIAVDGKPAAALTMTDLNEMFEQPVDYLLTIHAVSRP